MTNHGAMEFRVVCASGVLVSGTSLDFLVCVYRAIEARKAFAERLPYSSLRIQIQYQNKKKAFKRDIDAAIHALSDTVVMAQVHERSLRAAAIPPARSEARTAGIAAEPRLRARANAAGFSQAGVVAPPDSPDLGNCWIGVEEALGR